MEQPPIASNEKVFFNADGIFVSDSRFVSGSQTFPLRNVGSVRGETRQPNRWAGHFMAFCAVILLMAGCGGLMQSAVGQQSAGSGIGTILCGIIFAVGAWIAYRKREHVVIVSGAGGDTRAVTTSDPLLAQEIIDALNRAIIERR